MVARSAGSFFSPETRCIHFCGELYREIRRKVSRSDEQRTSPPGFAFPDRIVIRQGLPSECWSARCWSEDVLIGRSERHLRSEARGAEADANRRADNVPPTVTSLAILRRLHPRPRQPSQITRASSEIATSADRAQNERTRATSRADHSESHIPDIDLTPATSLPVEVVTGLLPTEASARPPMQLLPAALHGLVPPGLRVAEAAQICGSGKGRRLGGKHLENSVEPAPALYRQDGDRAQTESAADFHVHQKDRSPYRLQCWISPVRKHSPEIPVFALRLRAQGGSGLGRCGRGIPSNPSFHIASAAPEAPVSWQAASAIVASNRVQTMVAARD